MKLSTAVAAFVVLAGMSAGGTASKAKIQSPSSSSKTQTRAREHPSVSSSPPAKATPGQFFTVQDWKLALTELKKKRLILPIAGTNPERLKGSFYEKRGGGRRHEAADILAPRNTPVLAIEDGTIGKLWTSEAGGITIYQFDPSGKYVYYYAHLERYAENLKEGDKIRQGQTIGFVGTSGNAPVGTPHLHFSISKVNKPGKWYSTSSIDPYEVFGNGDGPKVSSPPKLPAISGIWT